MYSRDGTHKSTCEKLAGLGQALAWKPSGALIATTQLLPQRQDVVFFEKNGLRHGEFSLRNRQDVVRDMKWNSDSTILAILLEKEGDCSALQLWHSSNYHWYLGQEITCTSGPIACISWDIEVPLKLRIVSHSGVLQTYQLSMSILSGCSYDRDNVASVAVIDGCSLHLTPFRFAKVPPPMSHTQLTMPDECPVIHVSFGPNHGNDFAVLTRSYVALWTWSKPGYEQLGLVRFDECEGPLYPRQIVWAETSMGRVIVVVAHVETLEEDGRDVLLYSFGNKEFHRLTLSVLLRLLSYSADSTVILAQDVDFRLWALELGGDPIQGLVRLLRPGSGEPLCPLVPFTTLTCAPDRADSVLDRRVIGLTERNKLYVNERLLASNCTSIAIDQNFLMFTTFLPTLRFVSWSVNFDELVLPDEDLGAFDESFRRLERGAKIVTTVCHDIAVVLQLPRGNLETVYPRALALDAVRESLDVLDFATAFDVVRKHRIDVNLLYDHFPTTFLANTREFISQIKLVDHLNLFLSGLRNEDVTETAYRGLRRQPVASRPSLSGASCKVNLICDAIRTELESLENADMYVDCRLTALVRKHPPELEAALAILGNLRARGKRDAADKALKYLIFLVDVDALFNAALGMYDFDLVLMVAQRSQKDPKEYLALVAELEKLPVPNQRFKIDDHLKRYEKALGSLIDCGEGFYPEAVTYAQTHGLYNLAAALFRQKKAWKMLKDVQVAFGSHLASQAKLEEAGLGMIFPTGVLNRSS